ncbi:hypothetical protein DPMN_158615 [Dreissena polymorpha]|uniref:Uncharacterized protein n=1 Tax=Dreissena polymorpha TaxID=45954 RepID=A0A9D4EK54_DREPO|nr:hypothetical protein DPMN_158615 [Dreissena polymorpha]
MRVECEDAGVTPWERLMFEELRRLAQTRAQGPAQRPGPAYPNHPPASPCPKL